MDFDSIAGFPLWQKRESWLKVTENHCENRAHGVHFGSKTQLCYVLALFGSSHTPLIFAEGRA
jgi:hypothetical protein